MSSSNGQPDRPSGSSSEDWSGDALLRAVAAAASGQPGQQQQQAPNNQGGDMNAQVQALLYSLVGQQGQHAQSQPPQQTQQMQTQPTQNQTQQQQQTQFQPMQAMMSLQQQQNQRSTQLSGADTLSQLLNSFSNPAPATQSNGNGNGSSSAAAALGSQQQMAQQLSALLQAPGPAPWQTPQQSTPQQPPSQQQQQQQQSSSSNSNQPLHPTAISSAFPTANAAQQFATMLAAQPEVANLMQSALRIAINHLSQPDGSNPTQQQSGSGNAYGQQQQQPPQVGGGTTNSAYDILSQLQSQLPLQQFMSPLSSNGVKHDPAANPAANSANRQTAAVGAEAGTTAGCQEPAPMVSGSSTSSYGWASKGAPAASFLPATAQTAPSTIAATSGGSGGGGGPPPPLGQLSSYDPETEDLLAGIPPMPAELEEMKKRKPRGRSSTFPRKLYQMLMDLEDQDGGSDIASFLMPHGRAFRIHKPKEFTRDIMPKYFQMGSFSSFQRQLNLYDFQRITEGPERDAYYHEWFVRGQPLQCTRIKRNKGKSLTRAKQEERLKSYEKCKEMNVDGEDEDN